MLTFGSLCAFAHDPYEITSTLSLYSNRTELRVEMEARTALLFAGHSESVTSEQIPGIFTALHKALTDTASRFFKITVASRDMYPEKTSLLLGVEDHIQFTLQFPRARGQSIRCEPRVLNGFTNEGPYGISLTVLDMVNKKVLGQSVLFRDSSAAEFVSSPPLSETSSETLLGTKSDEGGSNVPATIPAGVVRLSRSDLEPAVQRSASPPAVQPSLPIGQKVAPILAAIAFLFVSAWSLIVVWRAKRKARPI